MTANKVKVSIIAVALLCASAAAQQNSRSGAVRLQNGESQTGQKVVTLAGRVSDGGKMLLSEDQDHWAVNNPGALASHAGHAVTVKCQLSPDQNSIHILSVKPAETKYVAAHNDAAFRR